MKTRARSVLAVVLMGVLGAGAVSIAQPPAGEKPSDKPGEKAQEPRRGGERGEGRGEGRPGPGGEGRGAISVESGMKMMNRAMKTLTAQITNGSKTEENLQLLGEMQRGCVSAKSGKLDKALKKFPEEQRAAKALEFRRAMIELAKVLLDAEEKLLDGKLDAAKSALEKAGQMGEKGHEALQVEEE